MEEFFKRMDRDFDGRLSFEEFMGELAENNVRKRESSDGNFF